MLPSLSELSRLFTLLALQEKESINASEEVTKVIREVTVELPLWEDWLLRGVFPEVNDKMVWEGKLEKREQGVARLVRIGEVRDWLCAHQDSKIAWSTARGQAYVMREEQGMGKKNMM
jgi:hypothetical protein